MLVKILHTEEEFYIGELLRRGNQTSFFPPNLKSIKIMLGKLQIIEDVREKETLLKNFVADRNLIKNFFRMFMTE